MTHNFLKIILLKIIILLIVMQYSFSQNDTVNLNQCYDEAIRTFPLAKEKELQKNATHLKMENLSKNWYPQMDVNGQFTYQSDVVEIDFPDIPQMSFDIPSPPKEQYKFTLDIKQTLYDGGRTNAAKQLEQAKMQTQVKQVEVELNKLKSRINRLYFTILILQENIKQVQVMLDEVKKRKKTVKSAVENGVLKSSDLNVLKAEKLKLEQNLSELEENKNASLSILAELTGLIVHEKTVLKIPEVQWHENDSLQRPEYELFKLQNQQLGAAKTATQKNRKPLVYAFGQAGYGNPGLNMMKDEAQTFYFAGAGVKWNIWDWNKTNREQQVLSLQQDIVKTKEETFDKNLQLEIQSKKAGIRKYEKLIRKDHEIIELREKVSESAKAQLEYGVITSTEYLAELNKEMISKINLETHKLLLIQSKIEYLTITGNL